jgi:hypothetical protein
MRGTWLGLRASAADTYAILSNSKDRDILSIA